MLKYGMRQDRTRRNEAKKRRLLGLRDERHVTGHCCHVRVVRNGAVVGQLDADTKLGETRKVQQDVVSNTEQNV